MSIPKRNRHENEDTSSAVPSTVSVVGLGCSSFSNFFWTQEELAEDKQMEGEELTSLTITRDHPKVREWIDTIIYAVKDCGISLLDTAPWYGHGTSEIVVGYALEELFSSSTTATIFDDDTKSDAPKITRESLHIQTKVGRYEAEMSKQFDFSYDTTISSTKRSLIRLSSHCEYIDVLQLHDPEFSPSLEILMKETIPAMVECRAKGWCKSLGLTGYPLEVQYQIFQNTYKLYGTNVWDQSLTYAHFNLHDSSLVHRRVSSSCGSFAQFCQQHNITVLGAAPLSMGLLTNNALPDWHPANGTELAQACQQAAEICRQHDVDIATLAILYSLSHPDVPCTILGMNSIEQVKKAATAANRFGTVDWTDTPLTQEDVLCSVLTERENNVFRILRDRESGPFASIWREEGEDKKIHSVAKYQWDGIREAHQFWIELDRAFEKWQHDSFR